MSSSIYVRNHVAGATPLTGVFYLADSGFYTPSKVVGSLKNKISLVHHKMLTRIGWHAGSAQGAACRGDDGRPPLLRLQLHLQLKPPQYGLCGPLLFIKKSLGTLRTGYTISCQVICPDAFNKLKLVGKLMTEVVVVRQLTFAFTSCPKTNNVQPYASCYGD